MTTTNRTAAALELLITHLQGTGVPVYTGVAPENTNYPFILLQTYLTTDYLATTKHSAMSLVEVVVRVVGLGQPLGSEALNNSVYDAINGITEENSRGYVTGIQRIRERMEVADSDSGIQHEWITNWEMVVS